MDAFSVCDDGAIMMLFGENTFKTRIKSCMRNHKDKPITFSICCGCSIHSFIMIFKLKFCLRDAFGSVLTAKSKMIS